MKYLLWVCFIFVASAAKSQVSVQITNTPPTLFESFSITKDAVMIKGISHIGELEGQVAYPIEVRVEELINIQTSNKVYGVVLRSKTPRQTVINYIDYDELDPLLSGMRYIVQLDHNATTLEHFNAYFQTRGGLTVSKYSVDNRNYLAVKTGLPESEPNIMDLPAMAQFETLLVAAKTKLDAIKRGDR